MLPRDDAFYAIIFASAIAYAMLRVDADLFTPRHAFAC